MLLTNNNDNKLTHVNLIETLTNVSNGYLKHVVVAVVVVAVAVAVVVVPLGMTLWEAGDEKHLNKNVNKTYGIVVYLLYACTKTSSHTSFLCDIL